jgi:hypothetical protein
MKHLACSLSLVAALHGPVLFSQAAPGEAAPKPLRELFTTGAGVTDSGVLQFNAGTQSG